MGADWYGEVTTFTSFGRSTSYRELDEDGDFWMVDRADDVIPVGGWNVYPAEVESALYERPDVAEAAVVGLPTR